MIKNSKKLIVKSNELNQYTFYKSSVQLKIFSKLIFEIRKDIDKQIYRISIVDILRDINFHKKDYKKLKEIVRKMGQMIEIPKEKGFKFSALFYGIETEDSTYLDFEINPRLKPYLLELSGNFTTYYFENVARLNSYYSIRIYELLKQYQNINLDGWWKVKIEDLKDILKINNEQYPKYSNFKRKVILQAQKELDEKTDIKFSIEEHKEGRKVVAVTFFILPTEKGLKNKDIIQSKEQIPLLPQIEAYLDTKEYKILKDDLQIKDDLIKKFFMEYSTELILKNAKYTLRELNKGNIKTSTGQFMFSALKNNYAGNFNSFNSEDVKEKEAEKRIKREKQEQEDIYLIEKLKKELENLNRKRLLEFVEKNLDEVYDVYVNEKNEIDKNKNKNSFISMRAIPFVEKSRLVELLDSDDLISIKIFRSILVGKYKTSLNLFDYAKKIHGISIERMGSLGYRIIRD